MERPVGIVDSGHLRVIGLVGEFVVFKGLSAIEGIELRRNSLEPLVTVRVEANLRAMRWCEPGSHVRTEFAVMGRERRLAAR